MQGRSFRTIAEGEVPEDWGNTLYYRYWVYEGEHGVSPHYGIRTLDYKLICYLKEARDFNGVCLKEVEDKEWPQWELFDLRTDSEELRNVYDDPAYQTVVEELKEKLYALKAQYQDYED
nr:sulfatase/phosphatase domain-containing protein [Holtiella tumoricola]